MKRLISFRNSWKSIVAVSLGGFVFASCSHDAGGNSNLEEYQGKAYSAAFAEEFGQPAADHNWGFGSFDMYETSNSIGSYEYFNSVFTRVEASNVTSVGEGVVYNTFEDVMKNETAKCYFYLKIDNRIVLQERTQVMSNPSEEYYPKGVMLNNGTVQDYLFSTDNEGEIYTEMFNKIANVREGGVSYAATSDPVPAELFKKAPTFETMCLHIPDADKIRLAGSVENFEKNYKIFWYVAKWQGAGDKKIHVDGVVVPKDQITINIPEYKKRIIVEDLKGNIDEKTKVNSSDFDFNDAVVDAVVWNRDGKLHLKVLVRAAGGRLPIYVNGKEIHTVVDYMSNTSNPDYNFYKELISDEVIGYTPTVDPIDGSFPFDFNSIPVKVVVDGNEVTAGANIGEAPEKIAVGIDYKWCKEKQNIKDVYSNFPKYVANKSLTNWWE